jgi:hypothetical protein
VDRGRHRRVDLAGQGELDHRPDRLEGCVARHGRDLAQLEPLAVDVAEVVYVDHIGFERGGHDAVDRADVERCANRTGGAADDRGVADDDRAAQLADF